MCDLRFLTKQCYIAPLLSLWQVKLGYLGHDIIEFPHKICGRKNKPKWASIING